MKKKPPRLPRIGPCRCPLHLWYLEFREPRGVFRRYFADRDEARAALKLERQRAAASATDAGRGNP